MNTTDQAGAWTAGYADYLRDVVGASTGDAGAPHAHRATLCHGLLRAGRSPLDWLVRPAGDRVHSARGGVEDRPWSHGTGVRDPILPAFPGLARCRTERARPRHPGDPTRAARQPAAASVLRATRAAAGAADQPNATDQQHDRYVAERHTRASRHVKLSKAKDRPHVLDDATKQPPT